MQHSSRKSSRADDRADPFLEVLPGGAWSRPGIRSRLRRESSEVQQEQGQDTNHSFPFHGSSLAFAGASDLGYEPSAVDRKIRFCRQDVIRYDRWKRHEFGLVDDCGR